MGTLKKVSTLHWGRVGMGGILMNNEPILKKIIKVVII